MVKSQCLYSGEEFIPRRTNQKFASTKNRMDYHNSRYRAFRKQKAKYDEKLHKNFCVLNELLSDTDVAVYHKQFLKGKGFSFNVLTHFERVNGRDLPALYSFLIEPKGDEIQFKRIS